MTDRAQESKKEEIKARISKTESIDELRERWYKSMDNNKEQSKEH